LHLLKIEEAEDMMIRRSQPVRQICVGAHP
jgi:hypothetical protein